MCRVVVVFPWEYGFEYSFWRALARSLAPCANYTARRENGGGRSDRMNPPACSCEKCIFPQRTKGAYTENSAALNATVASRRRRRYCRQAGRQRLATVDKWIESVWRWRSRDRSEAVHVNEVVRELSISDLSASCCPSSVRCVSDHSLGKKLST